MVVETSTNKMDIIKTIEDDEEVANLSEDSDVEVEVRILFLKLKCLFLITHVLLFLSINQQSRRD